MSKSVRIRTTPDSSNDKYLKVKLDQDFDFIEILSLKISQDEAYTRYCSDYGAVVGRVIINNGFGVANAKVSIFIPISDEDKEDSEISGLYPYEVLTDKGSDGIRYNLLQKDPNPAETCFTPVGSFPSKREVIDNDTTLEVYEKYYKFTTTTNDAGDYMLFGVPVGSHTINIDVDLSDIGLASQRPYDYISQGESIKRFDKTTKFKDDKDLDKLIQIKHLTKGINVQPFWGDDEQCDVGITRVDFDVKKKVIPSAIFMGNIFTDSDKNSVNKNCKPAKGLGRICDSSTGEGTILMIRKKMDGTIERFDVEGGRVMTDSGAWAYQVPMNLDFVVTDEFGNLQPSEDPDKGIATRTEVRFKIGLDATGNEGRLRTSAKYLVPHNPTDYTKIDYRFDENTGHEHFRNMYWNKVYTVSNFIPRIQTRCIGNLCAEHRAITGLKDVDNCAGTKNAVPYNRVDVDFNPLFFVICVLLSIIVYVIFLINGILIRLINYIIKVVNYVLEVICDIIFAIGKVLEKAASLISKIPFVSWSLDKCDYCIGNGCCECEQVLSYVACITLDCDEQTYSPGCDCSTVDNAFAGSQDVGNTGSASLGCWASISNAESPKTPIHWTGLNYPSTYCGHDGHNVADAGLSDCFAISLAEALNVFEFDFYNDWLNGSLYAYLLKFKRNKRDKQKFCDVDCPDGGAPSDNNCGVNWFVDTCVKNDGEGGLVDGDIKKVTAQRIHEGYIKKVTRLRDDGTEEYELFYTPYTTEAPNYKMFATELVHLGSVFDCDWQGIPKIHQHLIPSTYKRPPLTTTYLEDGTTSPSIITQCGMSSTGKDGHSGVFFDINCVGLKVGSVSKLSFPPTDGFGIIPFRFSRCTNFKRICEMGVTNDLTQFSAPSVVQVYSDCKITNDEIAQPWGGLFRDIFYTLNSGSGQSKLDSWPVTGLPSGLQTGFDANGFHHASFRGGNNSIGTFDLSRDNYGQPDNSMYFYFGSIPGQSAVDLLKSKFTAECPVIETNAFLIQLDAFVYSASTGYHTSSPSACDGSINITVVGGSGNFTYVWSGPSGYTNTQTTPQSGDIFNLCAGLYTVIVYDNDDGGSSTTNITLVAPASLSCNLTTTPAVVPGGFATLNLSIGGGVPPVSYTVNPHPSNLPPAPIIMSTNFEQIPVPAGTYTVTVNDASLATCTTNAVTASTIPVVVLPSITDTETTCGLVNGTVTMSQPSGGLGGQPPYSYATIDSGNNIVSTSTNTTGLPSGTYQFVIYDSSYTGSTTGAGLVAGFGSGGIDNTPFTINPSVPAVFNVIPEEFCWFDPNPMAYIRPSFNITSGVAPFTITWVNKNNTAITGSETFSSAGNVTFSNPLNDYFMDFILTDNDGCTDTDVVDFQPGFGTVPSYPSKIEWVQEKFCNTNIINTAAPTLLITSEKSGIITWTGPTPSQNIPFAGGMGVPVVLPSLNFGSYTFTFTDSANITTQLPPSILGCTMTTSVNLSAGQNTTTGGVPTPLTVNVSYTAPTGGQNPSNGTISGVGSGGWPTYTYTINRNGVPITAASTYSIPSSEDNQGITYSVTVTDSEGCTVLSNTFTT